ncbi:HVO_A0114 family putative DNA-binding protein [Methylorubrum extorquens]
MAKTEIEVGRSLREAAADVAKAWKAAQDDQPTPASDRILFRDWAALCAVLTPKRYELLRHLRRSPESGIRALARSLGRDVRRVHQDVVALTELGLVTREADGRLSSDVDEITSTIRIAA